LIILYCSVSQRILYFHGLLLSNYQLD
jgi:hypothetical protein